MRQAPPQCACAASCAGARTPSAVTHPSLSKVALSLPNVGLLMSSKQKSKSEKLEFDPSLATKVSSFSNL